MSTWYERGVFYHMYPLGMTGAPKHNEGTEITHRFDELNRYIPHLSQLGFNAIYIGPLFESSSHGYDTRDYKLVDRRLGTNDDFRTFVRLCHEQEIRVVPAAARREESHVPWLAILLCALFLAGGAWYFRDSIPGLSSNTVSREKTASPAVSSPAVPEADTVVTTPAIPVEPAANATLPAASEEPIVLGGTPLPAETETPTEQAALPATGHRMLLTAQGDCWVSTTADGKNSQRVMHKGDTLNVDFQEKLVMKLGNAGAMLITYDGKELPPVGKIGQVKTVTFPNDAQN